MSGNDDYRWGPWQIGKLCPKCKRAAARFAELCEECGEYLRSVGTRRFRYKQSFHHYSGWWDMELYEIHSEDR